MNVLILLNGTYGVGKTSVAHCISSISNNAYMCIDPDEYYNDNLAHYLKFGWPAANNSHLMKSIRNEVENKIQKINIVIPVTLNSQSYIESWTKLFSDIAEVRHVILYADNSKVKERIINDDGRDKEFALDNLHFNKIFNNRTIKGAIVIDTSDLTIEEVSLKILDLIP